MDFLLWIVVGLITGSLTRKLLTGDGYGRITEIVTGLAGGAAGGFIMNATSSQAYGGLVYTSLTAFLGAGILTGLSVFVSECYA